MNTNKIKQPRRRLLYFSKPAEISIVLCLGGHDSCYILETLFCLESSDATL